MPRLVLCTDIFEMSRLTFLNCNDSHFWTVTTHIFECGDWSKRCGTRLSFKNASRTTHIFECRDWLNAIFEMSRLTFLNVSQSLLNVSQARQSRLICMRIELSTCQVTSTDGIHCRILCSVYTAVCDISLYFYSDSWHTLESSDVYWWHTLQNTLQCMPSRLLVHWLMAYTKVKLRLLLMAYTAEYSAVYAISSTSTLTDGIHQSLFTDGKHCRIPCSVCHFA